MIKMLELICAIPDEYGWELVGFARALAFVMGIQVGKLIYTAIRDRLVDDEECEE